MSHKLAKAVTNDYDAWSVNDPVVSTEAGGEVADLCVFFTTTKQGGRSTDPSWTERRQLPLRRETLDRLEKLATTIREHGGGDVHPMQIAALLLEKVAENATEEEILGLVAGGHE